MTTTVSFTNFRDNLSDHLDYLKAGNSIVIRNAKKDEDVLTLMAKKEDVFDWKTHIKWVKTLAGSGLLAGKEDEFARKKFRNDINKRFAVARKR